MKVICDVCGTTFSETATNCPICGCAAPAPAQTVADDVDTTAKDNTTAAAYSRGGRFAKSNVKRNARSHTPERRTSESRSSGERNRDKDTQQGSKGLIAVVIILLLAIIVVVVYIGVNVLFKTGNNQPDAGGNNQDVPQTSFVGNGQTISCTSIKLSYKYHEFNEASAQLQLAYEKEPANATDTVTYESSDPEVATVDNNGMVRPGTKQGTVVITVTCGSGSDQCTIVSKVGEEPPASSGPAGPDVNIPEGFVLKLVTYKDSGEITLAGDATHVLYKETMGVKASDINWTTSDPAIATVENGKVTGVGKGYCFVTAAIGDQTATCKVICTSNAAPPSDYKISHVDVTIAVGETFNLYLMNKETGANVRDIEWQVSEEGVVSINGNKITGQAVAWSGIQVFVEYEGVTYSCRIIVKPAE